MAIRFEVGQAVLVIEGATAAACRPPPGQARGFRPRRSPPPISRLNRRLKAEPAAGSGGSIIEFKLRALGEGVTSADVADIMVKEEDTVTAGQSVVELETEKAVVEVPEPQRREDPRKFTSRTRTPSRRAS